MKTALIATLLALSSQTSFAAPLAIEPSEAFSEAVKLATQASRDVIGNPDARIFGQLQIHRGKFKDSEFGDFRITLQLEDGAVNKTCVAGVMIHRLPVSERPENSIVLETDSDTNMITVARNIRARCQ